MARLYEQGWSIEQVSAKFSMSYDDARQILLRRTPLRASDAWPFS
jgi:hypothetical protein